MCQSSICQCRPIPSFLSDHKADQIDGKHGEHTIRSSLFFFLGNRAFIKICIVTETLRGLSRSLETWTCRNVHGKWITLQGQTFFFMLLFVFDKLIKDGDRNISIRTAGFNVWMTRMEDLHTSMNRAWASRAHTFCPYVGWKGMQLNVCAFPLMNPAVRRCLHYPALFI